VHIPANESSEDNTTIIISDVSTSSSARKSMYVFEPGELNDMTNASAGTGTTDVILLLDTSYWSPVKVTGVEFKIQSKSRAITDKKFSFRHLLHATVLT
jgi:hypothetical protein